ncbi:hypothetical protein Esti_003936 [Eimeria stiedai]
MTEEGEQGGCAEDTGETGFHYEETEDDKVVVASKQAADAAAAADAADAGAASAAAAESAAAEESVEVASVAGGRDDCEPQQRPAQQAEGAGEALQETVGGGDSATEAAPESPSPLQQRASAAGGETPQNAQTDQFSKTAGNGAIAKQSEKQQAEEVAKRVAAPVEQQSLSPSPFQKLQQLVEQAEKELRKSRAARASFLESEKLQKDLGQKRKALSVMERRTKALESRLDVSSARNATVKLQNEIVEKENEIRKLQVRSFQTFQLSHLKRVVTASRKHQMLLCKLRREELHNLKQHSARCEAIYEQLCSKLGGLPKQARKRKPGTFIL